MNLEIGAKALLTTNNWFYAPDGKSYSAVFGTIKAVRSSEDTLGVRTNAKSTNWYVEIGNMTIAGCQIFYAVRTDECNLETAEGWSANAEHGVNVYEKPSPIYNADK